MGIIWWFSFNVTTRSPKINTKINYTQLAAFDQIVFPLSMRKLLSNLLITNNSIMIRLDNNSFISSEI